MGITRAQAQAITLTDVLDYLRPSRITAAATPNHQPDPMTLLLAVIDRVSAGMDLAAYVRPPLSKRYPDPRTTRTPASPSPPPTDSERNAYAQGMVDGAQYALDQLQAPDSPYRITAAAQTQTQTSTPKKKQKGNTRKP